MFPFRQRRDGFPQPVMRREDSVIAMPVLPRRRHEIGEPVEELKRRDLDDAIGPWPRGLPPAARADPGGGCVPWQRGADAGDTAVWAADHGETMRTTAFSRSQPIRHPYGKTLSRVGCKALFASPRRYVAGEERASSLPSNTASSSLSLAINFRIPAFVNPFSPIG
jgi:hypothetical protein